MLQAAAVRPTRPPVGARGGNTARVSRVANEGSLREQSAGGGGANQEANDHPWGANEQRIERELVDWIKGDRALFERLLLFETVNIHLFHSKVRRWVKVEVVQCSSQCNTFIEDLCGCW